MLAHALTHLNPQLLEMYSCFHSCLVCEISIVDIVLESTAKIFPIQTINEGFIQPDNVFGEFLNVPCGQVGNATLKVVR